MKKYAESIFVCSKEYLYYGQPVIFTKKSNSKKITDEEGKLIHPTGTLPEVKSIKKSKKATLNGIIVEVVYVTKKKKLRTREYNIYLMAEPPLQTWDKDEVIHIIGYYIKSGEKVYRVLGVDDECKNFKCQSNDFTLIPITRETLDTATMNSQELYKKSTAKKRGIYKAAGRK